MQRATPMRYPGGKAKLYPYICKLLNDNNINYPNYIEAFAGGSGLALKLLLNEKVNEIYINDFDRAIWAIWYSILNYNDQLVEMIQNATFSIEEWKLQKEVYMDKENAEILSLGYASLFLNRTNRSGILMANPIGGMKQDGNYLIDCRFNKITLIKQIRLLFQFRNRIHLSNQDAKEFILKIDKEVSNTFFYLDPPYVQKGHQLYKNSFLEIDHISLRDAIAELNSPWFVTYDDCVFIENLYNVYRQEKFSINYSVQTVRKGIEIAIYSTDLRIIPSFE